MKLEAKQRLQAKRYPKSTTFIKVTQKIDKKLNECLELLSDLKSTSSLDTEDEKFRLRMTALIGEALYRD